MIIIAITNLKSGESTGSVDMSLNYLVKVGIYTVEANLASETEIK